MADQLTHPAETIDSVTLALIEEGRKVNLQLQQLADELRRRDSPAPTTSRSRYSLSPPQRPAEPSWQTLTIRELTEYRTALQTHQSALASTSAAEAQADKGRLNPARLAGAHDYLRRTAADLNALEVRLEADWYSRHPTAKAEEAESKGSKRDLFLRAFRRGSGS